MAGWPNVRVRRARPTTPLHLQRVCYDSGEKREVAIVAANSRVAATTMAPPPDTRPLKAGAGIILIEEAASVLGRHVLMMTLRYD